MHDLTVMCPVYLHVAEVGCSLILYNNPYTIPTTAAHLNWLLWKPRVNRSLNIGQEFELKLALVCLSNRPAVYLDLCLASRVAVIELSPLYTTSQTAHSEHIALRFVESRQVQNHYKVISNRRPRLSQNNLRNPKSVCISV